MGKEIKKYWKCAPVWAKSIFWTLLILCFIIFVIVLIEPPEWDINPNVLKGIAMFMGFASYGVNGEMKSVIRGLPTSSTGLIQGQMWSDDGILKIKQ